MRDSVPTSETSRDAGSGVIQSVERAAAILSFFTASRPTLSLQEITNKLHVSKATAHRYAVSLRRANLLRYDPVTATYTLGPRIITLAGAARAGLPVLQIAAAHIEALVAELNETAVLCIWDGEAPVVVLVDDRTERIVRISVQGGSRLPVFESAQGLLFYAFLPARERPKLPGGQRGARLAEEIEQIRRTGIAFRQDVVPGTAATAVPVMQGDRIVATIAVVSTSSLLTADPDSLVAGALRTTAKVLSLELGESHDVADLPDAAESVPRRKRRT